MEDINLWILIGRLTRDAELKYSNGGLAVSTFALAINKRKRVGEDYVDEVHYFDMALLGKKAEALNQYLVKGKQICAKGSLSQDRWEQDGAKRSKIALKCDSVQLLAGGNPAESNNDIF